ncbi:hypothetical protein NZD85_11535 [Empedobacter stercoris]|uniref:hypothetical protein n=1 Tax=Empedobacter stercoris TaxID=1628248 RepID=UPI0021AECFE8|nr:hypothetical protein [Empedobacter stercoris]UWX66507.1 hypothetical protein NZD85_11535 [Empedobacter stercoris]
MKTKNLSLQEIISYDSPALTAIIYHWREYDQESVILSYLELTKRDYQLSDRGHLKKLHQFEEFHKKTIDALSKEYLENEDIDNYTEYSTKYKKLLIEEDRNKPKNTLKNNKTIFSPLNICLFIGLCIGCYLPVSLLIKNNSTPKCSDKEVVLTVQELLKEKVSFIDDGRTLTNIVTIENNTEMNNCTCKATLPGVAVRATSREYNEWNDGTIVYTIEKTDDGETLVSLIDFLK